MKHDEQISILLKAIRGVVADDELTKAEREDVLRETYRGRRTAYRARWSKRHCGRSNRAPDGLRFSRLGTVRLALAILQGKAAALRKAQPDTRQIAGDQSPLPTPRMPKSRRSSVRQPARNSRNRRPPHTQATICKRTLPSPSATTRFTP